MWFQQSRNSSELKPVTIQIYMIPYIACYLLKLDRTVRPILDQMYTCLVYVMVDFICVGLVEFQGMGSKLELHNQRFQTQWDSNQYPLNPESDAQSGICLNIF